MSEGPVLVPMSVLLAVKSVESSEGLYVCWEQEQGLREAED